MFDVPAPREHNRWGEGEDEEENAFDFLFDSSLSDEDDHSEAGALKIECFGYCSLSALWKDGYISAPALASLSPPPEEKEEAEAQGPEERREEIRDHHDTQPTIAESPAGEQGPDIEAGTEAEEEITTDHAEGEITPAANATEAVPLPGLDHHQNMLRLLQQRTEARLERRQAATREYYYQYSLNFVDTPYKWSSPKRIFLNLIENMIPLWLSPNALSLLGLSCSLASFGLLGLTSQLAEAPEDWVLFVCGLLMISYHILSSLTLRHAKRTNTMSALTEVVFYVCHALACPLIAMSVVNILQVGIWFGLILFIAIILPVYTYQWKKIYHTPAEKAFKLNSAVHGRNLCVLLYLGSCIISFIDSDFWAKELLGSFTIGKSVALCIIFTSAFLCLYNFVDVCAGLKTHLKDLPRAVFQQIPMSIAIILGSLWAFAAHPLYTLSPRLFMSTIGLLYAYILVRLICQRICPESIRLMYAILTPLGVLIGNSFLVRLHAASTTTKTETVIAYLYFTLALANFLTCFVLVCRQLSRHLKEPLLILPKEPYLPLDSHTKVGLLSTEEEPTGDQEDEEATELSVFAINETHSDREEADEEDEEGSLISRRATRKLVRSLLQQQKQNQVDAEGGEKVEDEPKVPEATTTTTTSSSLALEIPLHE